MRRYAFLYGILFTVLAMGSSCVTVENRSQAKGDVALQYSRLANAYLQRGELELALTNLKKAIENEPQSYEATVLLGVVYERLNRNDVAAEYYLRAVDLAKMESHEYAAARNNYAVFLCRRGKIDNAFEQFNDAIADQLYRTPEVAYENMGACALSSSGKYNAESYFQKALEINPSLSRSLWELSKLNYTKKEYLKARAFLQRFHSVSNALPDTLLLGVRIEKSLGDKVLLDRYVQELKEKFPDSMQEKQLSEILSSNI